MQQPSAKKIGIGIVDDHQLFSKSLSLLITGFAAFDVVLDAINGLNLQQKMKLATILPEIMLIDVSMPVMDGPHTARWLKDAYPDIRLVALSMSDQEKTIIEMFKAGCCAYLFKDIHPDELERALEEVYHRGYYNADSHNINFQTLLKASQEESFYFLEREIEFLRYACMDLTYREVAVRMNLSERTIDGYREALFKKLGVQSRTSMALEAIRRGLIEL